jgi:hypothetical protein
MLGAEALMAKRTNRVARGLVVLLAVVGLVALGMGYVWLRPYYMAKYRGHGASLTYAFLPGAKLYDAELTCANLRGAILRGADLRHANLGWAGDGLLRASRSRFEGANLAGANLIGADLRHANLFLTNLSGADLRGANLLGTHPSGAQLRGARYDAQTRWPKGFDPQRHGAVRVE